MARKSTAKRQASIAFLVAISWFITIRLLYWLQTVERPFSDMADYFDIARRVLCCFDFSHSPFWASYKPPVLPFIGALAYLISDDNPLAAWRFIQLAITLGSLIWFALELNRVTERVIFGVALIFIVALSKSSVFWSYKFATEGLTEAFVYLLLAATLWTLRVQRRTNAAFFLLGMLYTGGTLLRPNLVILTPTFITLYPFFHGKTLQRRSASIPRLAAFLLGVSLAWSPWLYRSYRLYGHVVPLSTQGPYSFLWELGGIEIRKPDGTTETKDVTALQLQAPHEFRNDYEAAKYASRFVSTWLRKHWKDDYPQLIGIRLRRTLFEREIALSQVSRTELFNGLLNELLIDKKPILLLLGASGLGLLSLLAPERLFMLLPITLLPVFFALLFVGDPRFLEPTLPLISYGNVAFVIGFWEILRRKRSVRLPRETIR